MKLRYISLRAEYGSYDDSFFHVFMENVRFISNFLSRNIRTYQIQTDGTYDMICVSITASEDSCQLESENVLSVKIHFGEESLDNYMRMKDENVRFEYYLSLLEKGYAIASKYKDIPYDTLLDLHNVFRDGGYKNERLFKKKTIREYGIYLKLFHMFSSYDYKLMMYVYKLNNEFLGEGCIYQTFPDEILFDKNVRHLEIKDGYLIVTDFLDHPQFVCSLDDLSKGIVKSICVDENTRKYIYNEENAEAFERLKWK